VIAGALLYCPYAEDSIYKGLITAMTLVGAIIGGIAGGGIGDRIGRRKALLVGSVMFVAGGGVMVVPWGGLGLLLVGRFLVGIGVGLASLLVPVYLAEMASASQRGTLTFAPVCIPLKLLCYFA
jgi:MFS family permease